VSFVVALFALAIPSFAAHDVPDQAFVDGAKPLIEALLTEKNRLYATSLEIVPDTWAVKIAVPLQPLDYAVLYGHRLDGSCREVSAVVNVRSRARARFHVKLTRPPTEAAPKEPGPNRFALVADCRNDALENKPPELRIDGIPPQRIFGTNEFTAIATPMIKTFLRGNGKSDAFDESALDVRKSGVDLDNGFMRRIYRKMTGRTRAMDKISDDDDLGSFSWTYRKLFGRNLACRRVRVFLPAESAFFTTYVSVWYRTDALAPSVPAELQTIYHDPLTLRPYRFSLANGCDKFGLFEAPTLKLISVPRPPALPAPPVVEPIEPSAPVPVTPSAPTVPDDAPAS
jgi:hypothetical protein